GRFRHPWALRLCAGLFKFAPEPDRDGDNHLIYLLRKMDEDFTWEYVCDGERFNIFMKCFLASLSYGGRFVTQLHYPVYHSPWSGDGHWPEGKFKALLERPLSESFPSDAIQDVSDHSQQEVVASPVTTAVPPVLQWERTPFHASKASSRGAL